MSTDPTIYDVPTPAEVEEMERMAPIAEPCPYCDAEMPVNESGCEACGREHPDRFKIICTCRGNNDCDGSCQCPAPAQ